MSNRKWLVKTYSIFITNVGCKIEAEIIKLKMELKENEGMRDITKHAHSEPLKMAKIWRPFCFTLIWSIVGLRIVMVYIKLGLGIKHT